MLHSPVLDSILKGRGAVIELVIAAVFLALGVNLLATVVGNAFVARQELLLGAGAALTFVSLGLIARRAVPAMKVSREFSGFLCVGQNEAEFVEVPGYDYSEELVGYMKALFAENEAPKKLWIADPLSKSFEFSVETGLATHRLTEAGKLIVEGTEYFVLEKLSTHLTDYFNRPAVEQSRISTLRRENIPGVLLGNRFLDTFSRPRSDRAAFVDEMLNGSPLGTNVVASYGPNGYRYAQFDLILPSGARLERTSLGQIEVDTPKFTLSINVKFDGYASVLPRDFDELYLGRPEGVNEYLVEILTSVSFKPLSLLSQSGWEYHAWIDSFLASLEADFSKKLYFSRIDWERVAITARMIKGFAEKKSVDFKDETFAQSSQ